MTPPPKQKTPYQGFKEQTNFLDAMGKLGEDLWNDKDGGIPVDVEALTRAAQYVKDAVGRLGGKMVPATTRLDQESGEALARWMVADQWGREAAGHYTDLVLGKNATTMDKVRFGQMITEMRLGYMRAMYRRLGNNANVRAAKDAAKRARAALRHGETLLRQTKAAARGKPLGSPEQLAPRAAPLQAVRALRKTAEDLEKKARTIGKYNKLANNVGTTIGKPNQAFNTNQEFFNYRDSARGRAERTRYLQVVKVLDDMYERSLGWAPGSAQSRGVTQIPGMTVNLKSIAPGGLTNRPGMFGSGPGPKNYKIRKNKFARQAKGNAWGYDTDFGRMMEHSFGEVASLAAQGDFVRTAVRNGVAELAKPGKQSPDFKQVSPFTALPRGTAMAKKGDVLYVKNAMHGEVVDAFNASHQNTAVKVLKGLNSIFMVTQLASFVDAASHGLNLTTAMILGKSKDAGQNALSKALTGLENKNLLPDMMKGIQKRLMSDYQVRQQLLELSRVGANRAKHHSEGNDSGSGPEGGRLDEQATAGGSPQGPLR